MIDYNSLFKVSYGVYIVSSGNKAKASAYISNTVFQVTSSPAKFATSCNKNNFTSELIAKHQSFSVSVLHKDVDSKTFSRFGFKSGRDFDKFAGINMKYSDQGTPVVLDDSIAYMDFKVLEKHDMGSHWLFIGELLEAEVIGNKEPITYDYYQKVKKGKAPKNAPTYIDNEKLSTKTDSSDASVYECVVCGHIYDDGIEDIKFEELPDDWTCPTCGAEKDEFIKIKN